MSEFDRDIGCLTRLQRERIALADRARRTARAGVAAAGHHRLGVGLAFLVADDEMDPVVVAMLVVVLVAVLAVVAAAGTRAVAAPRCRLLCRARRNRQRLRLHGHSAPCYGYKHCTWSSDYNRERYLRSICVRFFNNRDDLKLLFHELEHVGQYGRRGGVCQFLAEYISKIPGKVISNISFLIHDDIDIERAAIAKSEEVIIDYYGWYFYISNECSHPLSFAFNYLMTDGTWKTTGYWSAEQNEGFKLVSGDNIDLHSKNKLFYIYAEATDDSGVKWNWDSANSDDRTKTVQEDNWQLLFTKYVVVDSNPDKLIVSFSCHGK